MAVGQNLTAHASLSTPVVITDSNTLVSNMSAMMNLGRAQIYTVSVLGLIYSLAAAGGKDYTTNHAGLIQDAKILLGGISLVSSEIAHNKLLIDAALYWSTGRAGSGGTLSSSVNALLLEGRDFISLPEETLERLVMALRYRLSV